jgi:small redox-active disulfide protein 2
MEIKIYGPGCDKCTKTAELVEKVVAETGAQAEIVKIKDIREIVMAGVMTTPAVSVDGVMKITGRVPTAEEVKSWL